MSVLLYQGNSLEVIDQVLFENSIDSMVTDPPAGISFMGKEWDSAKGGADEWTKSMSEIFKKCFYVMKPGAHGFVWALPRISHRTAMALEHAGFDIRDVVMHIFGSGFPKSHNVEKSTGDKKWEGWGTALKPACEHWILIRKPLSEKTVAKNVLTHGTGALNIDASRIEAKDQDVLDAAVKRMTGNNAVGWKNTSKAGVQPNSTQGRFPANFICSGSARDLLDEQSGEHHARGGKPKQRGAQIVRNDFGGASRFFYCAKASKSERGKGNNHPTVKAQKLMRYLITMITPPGGQILDPFMGSGSTGVAAKALGFDFTGIENEEEYFEIAKRRINAAK